jgi:imidazolonepropionase-like amidohydrolase
MRALTLAVLLTSCAAGRSTSPALAIVGGTVVHPATGAAEEATVIVAGDRIARVAAGVAPPPGAAVLDARGKYVIPGLIDAHVHFFQSANLFTRPDAADFGQFMPYAQEDRRNRARLPKTFLVWLASGVTGVADVGGPMWNFEVREAASKAELAPHVVVAGPLISTVDRPKLDLGDPPIVKVTSPEEARAMARRLLARKPDFVKLWFIREPGDDLAAKEAIVRAAAEESHANHVRFAVHATQLDTAKAALRAGADLLVHSVDDKPLDDEFLRLAKERDALYIPTLFVMLGYRFALSGQWQPTEEERALADPQILEALDLSRVPEATWPPRVRELAAQKKPVEPAQTMFANLRAVRAAGLRIALGTDAGNIGTVHGPSVFREARLMAEAGLTPLEVLRSATVGGAAALAMERELGDVAEGKLADLVVLDADPRAGVTNLARIHRVVRAGRVLDPRELVAQLR